jgi:hypothetical protein
MKTINGYRYRGKMHKLNPQKQQKYSNSFAPRHQSFVLSSSLSFQQQNCWCRSKTETYAKIVCESKKPALKMGPFSSCGRFVYHVRTLHNQVESQPSNDRKDERLLENLDFYSFAKS